MGGNPGEWKSGSALDGNPKMGRRIQNRKKPSARRRWIVPVIFLAIVMTGIILYKTLLSAERVKAIVTRLLSDGLGRPVALQSVLIHPFAGHIRADSVRVGFTKSEGMVEGAFLTLDRLDIRFRLLPLVQRRLEITSVSIEGPHLHLVPIPGEKVPPEETGKSKNLPVSLGLGSLQLRHFRFVLILPDSAGKSELVADNVCLNLERVKVPREYMETNRVQGSVLLFVRDGTLTYRTGEHDFSFPLRALIQGVWPVGNPWEVRGHIALGTNDDPDSARVRISVNAAGAGVIDSLDVKELSLSLDGQKVMVISGAMETQDTSAVVDFRLKNSPFSLNGIISTITALLPEGSVTGSAGLLADGSCSLTGGLQGDLNALKARVKLELQDGTADLGSTGLTIGQCRMMAEASGTAGKAGFSNGRFGAELFADSVILAGGNSAGMKIRSIWLELSGAFSPDFLPASGRLRVFAGSLLDSPAELRMAWSVPGDSVMNIDRLVLDAVLNGDSLNLGALPGPSLIEGKVQLQVHAGVRGLASGDVRASAVTARLGYATPAGKESTPPLELDMQVHGGMSPDHRFVFLDSACFRLNELLHASLNGSMDLQNNTLDATLSALRIENDRIGPFLPGALRKKMRNAAFFGHEIVRMRMRGPLSGTDTGSHIEGELSVHDAGYDQPSEGLAVKGAQLQLDFSGTTRAMSGSLAVGLGSLRLDTLLLRMPAGDLVTCRLGVKEKNFFADGRLELEPFGLSGEFSGFLSQENTKQDLNARLDVRFSSTDTVEVIPGFSMQGGFSCHVEAAALDTVENGMRFSALVGTEGLNVAYGGKLVLSQVQARIPLELDIDMKHQKLIPGKPESPVNWAEYESQRGIYEKLGFIRGYLRMEQARFGEYAFQSLDMDIDAERGRLSVPWFSVRLFGGNLGGSLEIQPGKGGKEEISYRIRAQASRIRASALAPVTEKNAEEDTELDATLSFQGKGIDPQGSLDLEGFFYITKMGPRFASTLLRAMDPQGSDRSIRLTRRLLNMGWKPKLFSFELRHGYVYPALALSQPWFSPIRIPGQLEYGRLPLEFFLKYKGSQ